MGRPPSPVLEVDMPKFLEFGLAAVGGAAGGVNGAVGINTRPR